jgi:hypothetical protein
MVGSSAIAKPLNTQSSAQMRKQWCLYHKTWRPGIWKCLQAVPCIRISLRLKKPQSRQPGSVKQGTGEVLWVPISWYSVSPIITLHARITARESVCMLGNQVHPMIQKLLPNDVVFQDDNIHIHTAGTPQSWFKQHDGELQHLLWPA